MIIDGNTQFFISLSTIGAIVIVIWRAAVVFTRINDKIKDCSELMDQHSKDIYTIKEENTKTKVLVAVIETKLDNIDFGITEIKTMLVRHIERN